MVFSPSPDKIESARFLQKKISKKGFKVNACLLNRAWVNGLGSENMKSKDPGQSLESGYGISRHTDDSPSMGSGRRAVKENRRKESELFHFFSCQKEKSLQLMSDFKKEQNDPYLEFFLLPDMEIQMDSRQDIIQFSKNMRNQWRKI